MKWRMLTVIGLGLVLALVTWWREAPAGRPPRTVAADRDLPVVIKDVAITLPAHLEVTPGATAFVELTVNGDGTVRAARVFSSDAPDASDAVVAAVKQYRFAMPDHLKVTGSVETMAIQIVPAVAQTVDDDRP